MTTSTDEILSLAQMRIDGKSGRARAIREAANVRQAEVARALGVTQTSVSRWECGLRLPRGDKAREYAAMLTALEQLVTHP